MSTKSDHDNSNNENDELITWDHPLVKDHGICPGYLLRKFFPYTDGSWEKNCQQHLGCRNLMGEAWFYLPDLLAKWPRKSDEKD